MELLSVLPYLWDRIPPLKPPGPSFLCGKVFNYGLSLLISPVLRIWGNHASPCGFSPQVLALQTTAASVSMDAHTLRSGCPRGPRVAGHLETPSRPLAGYLAGPPALCPFPWAPWLVRHLMSSTLKTPASYVLSVVSLFPAGKVNPGPVVHLGWKWKSAMWVFCWKVIHVCWSKSRRCRHRWRK